MDKRDELISDIKELVSENCDYTHKLYSLLKRLEKFDQDYKPAPPRTVDENTPEGTLCVFGRTKKVIRKLQSVYINTGAVRDEFSEDWNIDAVERFVGINLLPNPGYDGPPVSGLVLGQGSSWLTVKDATCYTWSATTRAPLLWWAPVEWKDGQLVVREEALR